MDQTADDVLILTVQPLLPSDTDIRVDLYLARGGTVTLVTPGTTNDVQLRFVSNDARRTVFRTSAQLVPEDTDNSFDSYVLDLDTVPPVATVDGPSGSTSARDAAFEVGTVDGDHVWLDCRVDGGPWSRCDGGYQLEDLALGSHQVEVHAWDAASNRSINPASRTWTVVAGTPGDSVPPTGSITINGGAAFTTSTTVTLATPASDVGSGLAVIHLSNNGSGWVARSYSPSQSWTLPSTNGTKRVYAKWQDVAGNWSTVKSDTIVLDTVAPTAGKPGRAFLKGKALSAGAIATRISWTGSDATSGVARYELHQQTDGGSWAAVSTSLTKTLTDRWLLAEHTYRFRVRAVDQAGNVGAWAYGDAFRVSRLSETNGRISYSGTWSTSKASVFWGGQAKASPKAGSRAALTFTGRSVAWVASIGPTRGKADVYVNGSKVATVDLHSATSKHQQVVWAGSWTTAASRTISIRVQGTSGRPRVDLDAFVTAN